MSRKKQKLVLKTKPAGSKYFTIVKSINTLDFGVPGELLTRDEVNRILINHSNGIRDGSLTVEFIT